jgi:hypothetical protein
MPRVLGRSADCRAALRLLHAAARGCGRSIDRPGRGAVSSTIYSDRVTRFASWILIVALTAGSASAALCDVICADTHAAAPASTHDCHESPVPSGTGQLSADHACVKHGPDRVAVLTATESTRDPAAIAINPAHSGAGVNPVSHSAVHTRSAARTCRSTAGAAVPLRI